MSKQHQQEGDGEEVYVAKSEYHQVDHVDLLHRVVQSPQTGISCLQESNRKEGEFIH